MKKVNTGNRTPAEDQAALAKITDERILAANQKVVVEDGATYIVETHSSGISIKTRVA